MKLARLIKRYRVDKPEKFRLADIDPGDTAGFDKTEDKTLIDDLIGRIAKRQEILYAQDRWAVLALLQGMDTAGKDGVIEHVMSGVNPQGCLVTAFKRPTPEELEHDFLWRAAQHLPPRGRIGLFNRSYYEEVLVVRVHPEFLADEKMPKQVVSKKIWQQRFEDIRAFERRLARGGTKILKFHLRISKEEQRKRLLERLDIPSKRWKFSTGDIAERALWDKYMDAYEDMIRNTSTPEAPWYVVPANHKWFGRLVVAAVMANELERLDLKLPKIGSDKVKELKAIEKTLKSEAPQKARAVTPKRPARKSSKRR